MTAVSLAQDSVGQQLAWAELGSSSGLSGLIQVSLVDCQSVKQLCSETGRLSGGVPGPCLSSPSRLSWACFPGPWAGFQEGTEVCKVSGLLRPRLGIGASF